MSSLRNTSKSKGIFLFVIAIYALLAPPIFSGDSLCIGKDGHVEFESSSTECCAKPGNDSAVLQSATPAEECEICLDISFGEDVQPASFPSPKSIPSGALNGIPVTFLFAPVFETSRPNAPPSVAPFLVLLRTTLLLI